MGAHQAALAVHDLGEVCRVLACILAIAAKRSLATPSMWLLHFHSF